MTISPDDAVGHLDYKGQTYFFCSESCLHQFRATPEAFLGGRAAAIPASPADMEREYTCPMDPEVRQKGPGACPECGMALEPVDFAPITKTEWTCPMHPEVVRDEPGSCPICGMALEPRTVTLEESNPELEDMTRRFRWSALITAPILAFMVSEFLPAQPLQRILPHGWMNWIQLALATPVVLWGGWPFFARGWASVVNRHLNMVHADRARRRRSLHVPRRRDPRAEPVPGFVPHDGRRRGLLRTRRRRRGPRAARTGPRTSRPVANEVRTRKVSRSSRR